ncbi:MAG: DDE-type integrase/transposase/recombinase [Planctomycetota bacterium]|nr:DDE-type integrase/transposase/recombinase [Planctomycetota bacterium]
MRRKPPIPRGWNRHVKSSVLHVLSLSYFCFSTIRGWASRSRSMQVRLRTEIEDLKREIGLLLEEVRIKDARMSRIDSRRRPHYTPMERMAILELRTARACSAHQIARRFLLSPETISEWMGRIDEQGPRALLQLSGPVNRFPEFVRFIVQRLKLLCPLLGRKKIAENLCRAGLHLGASTVRRMLQERPAIPPKESVAAVPGPIVKAKGPDHIWHVDLTAVPIGGGFWSSWLPFALPQEWPFCWWVAVVVDHFSRRVQGVMIFEKKPGSYAIRSFLRRAIRQAGQAPRHLISDKGSQFFCDGFRDWCRRRGIKSRYGAVGKHGSIAVIERFNLTLKDECTRRIRVPARRERLRRELSLFVRWYNSHRPHRTLQVRTPEEIYRGLPPACHQPRLELRPRWPHNSKCASPQAPVDDRQWGTIHFGVTFLGGRRHLPVVSLRRAA